jgi:hypothetical protein
MDDSRADEVATRSRGVTSLAVATLILGGLRLVLSVLAIWFLVSLMIDGVEPQPRPPGAGRDFGDIDLTPLLVGLILPLLAMVGIAVAIVSLAGGILLVIAGMGLLRRGRFSRVLTLVLGALGAMLAFLYGSTLVDGLREGTLTSAQGAVLLAGLLVHGGYCTFVFVVLLNRKNAAEFT